jgi:hypothetical protein
MKKSNKKLIKILTFLALVIMLVGCCTTAFASQYHINGSITPTSTPFGGTVIAVVQFCCYAAAIIWVMIVGVKYMTSSPDGKAEMKKQAMAALIGGCILFSVGTIIKWIAEIVPSA